MPTLLTIPIMLMIAIPGGSAQHVRPDVEPAAAQPDRTQADWAEWEVESRILDGDYDGAVQAEQQAKADRQKIEPQGAEDRSQKR